jgi:simple sugar transport system permease protein
VQAGWTARPPVYFEIVDLGLPLRALDQFGLFYITVLLAIVLHLIIQRTRWGVELTALGEYPPAAAASGIRVRWRRTAVVIAGGAAAGLAGSYLSIMYLRQFGQNMTAGRGFLALAMVIFGRWQPLGLLLAGLFFGYVYAVETTLEVSREWVSARHLFQMAPYVLTLVALAGLAGRTRAPAALGQPFDPASVR